MKKTISIILVILLIISIIPRGAVAMESDDSYLASTDAKGLKADSIEPWYGEYEIVEPENVTYSSGTQDQYESNNSFYYATKIIETPDGEPTDTSVEIDATLHQGRWLFEMIEKTADEDYYYFDLLGEAEVSIKLSNIPSNYDYDLELYMELNYRYATEYNNALIIGSTLGDNSDEEIIYVLQPGRYYLWIYAYEGECKDSAYYNLSVDINYTARDESIYDLRYNKGAKAALWVSDYDPFGIDPLTSIVKETVGYEQADYVNGTYKDYYNNKFFNVNINGKENIEHVTLYIWDPTLASQILDYLAQLRNQAETELEENGNRQFKVTTAQNTSAVLGTVGSVILTLTPIAGTTGICFGLSTTLIPVAVDLVCVLLPYDDNIIALQNLIDYLNDLIEDIEVCAQTNGEVTVKIMSRYSATMSETINQVTYYCDFTPNNEGSNFHYFDTISAYNNSSIVNGRIYGIVDDTDVDNALNRVDYNLPNLNPNGYTTVGLNISMAATISADEYHMYEFTAPDDGWYSFYTEGELDTIGELFEYMVPSDATFGRIAYEDDIAEPDDGNDPDRNFHIFVNLEKGQTVYLRVSAYSSGSYTLKIE